jgi:hypothetical protein
MRQPVAPIEDPWTDRLSEYLDDELSAEERRGSTRICELRDVRGQSPN